MSNFGTHGTQKALNSAAKVAINKFMNEESAENIRTLRSSLEQQASLQS